MSEETVVIQPKKPGIVIFVSILHWLAVAWSALVSLILLLSLLFSRVLGGMEGYFRDRISAMVPANSTAGPIAFFAVILAVSLCFTGFFLFMALGILKGNKFSWYVQIALSVLGLLSFAGGLFGIPLTLINVLILFFFFTPRIRDYFKF